MSITTASPRRPSADPLRAAGARSARLLGLGQVALGVALTFRSKQIAASAAGAKADPAPGWLVRVLGLRSLVQGAVTAASPSPVVLQYGALVDATHAASMLPVVAVSTRYRRAAAISALTATISAAAGALAARATSERKRAS